MLGSLTGRLALVAAVLPCSPVDGRRPSRTALPARRRPAPRRPSRATALPPRSREEPPTAAEIDIDVAIKKIARLKSVAAEMVEEVNMLNQKFSIKGSYRKGPNNLVYLRLTVAGPPRLRRDIASGLRRRNALGLPGRA